MDVFSVSYLVVIDTGPPFTSAEFENWCRNKNIHLYHSPPWHLESNGLAGRHMQDVKVLLKRITRDEINPDCKEIVKKYNPE